MVCCGPAPTRGYPCRSDRHLAPRGAAAPCTTDRSAQTGRLRCRTWDKSCSVGGTPRVGRNVPPCILCQVSGGWSERRVPCRPRGHHAVHIAVIWRRADPGAADSLTWRRRNEPVWNVGSAARRAPAFDTRLRGDGHPCPTRDFTTMTDGGSRNACLLGLEDVAERHRDRGLDRTRTWTADVRVPVEPARAAPAIGATSSTPWSPPAFSHGAVTTTPTRRTRTCSSIGRSRAMSAACWRWPTIACTRSGEVSPRRCAPACHRTR